MAQKHPTGSTKKPPREILKKSHAHRSKKDYKRKPKHTKGKPND